MKRKKIKLGMERSILIGMITNTQYLGEIVRVYKAEFIEAQYARLVANWVVEYYNQTDQAPETDIASIWTAKRQEIDEELAELIDVFLDELVEDYDQLKITNVEYNVKMALDHFRLRNLTLLSEGLETAIQRGDVLLGEQVLANYNKVERIPSTTHSLFKDAHVIQEALNFEAQILLSLPGAVGSVIGPICRSDFMAFVGPQKRGKTWWLFYIAERAMRAGLKVLLISLEMDEAAIWKRLWQMITKQPLESGDVDIPVFEKDGQEKWTVRVNKEKKKGIAVSAVPKVQKTLKRMAKRGDIRVAAFSPHEVTLGTIETMMDSLEFYENFQTDILLTDYADIFAYKPQYKGETRHAINGNWLDHRAISLKRNIAVVTVSHSNKSTFNEDVGADTVSEDSRKLSHVTKMVAINQTEWEAERGVQRLGSMVQREGKRIFKQAAVIQALDIGQVCVDSKFSSECVLGEKPKKTEKKTDDVPKQRKRTT